MKRYCTHCSREYEPNRKSPWRCTECQHPLIYRWEPDVNPSPPPITDLNRFDGLWAFDMLLPISQEISFHEGFTPLVYSEKWDAEIKLDYVFPSGSFKDRGGTTTISQAVKLGVDHVIEDSSGNAGAAIAQYAAHANISADIYVPASASEGKISAISKTGANVIRIEGDREDVTDACLRAVQSEQGLYASHVWNPAFLVGTATFAFEIAAQRNWSVPDAIVVPIGHGTLALGAYQGFSLLEDIGWIESMPQIFGVQAAGYDPIATEFNTKTTTTHSNPLADGIQINDPPRKNQITNAISDTNGTVISIDEPSLERSLNALHQAGYYCEPTSAVVLAGLQKYRELDHIDQGMDVLLALTGSGLKINK
ncbi:MAG: pyridoxal-phosphate dependent enzyme [Halobacteriaceae archaeon]